MTAGVVLPLLGAVLGGSAVVLHHLVRRHEGEWTEQARRRVLAAAVVVSATTGTGLLGVRELFFGPLGPQAILGAFLLHLLAAIAVFLVGAFVAGASSDEAGAVVGVLLVLYALATLQGTVALFVLGVVAFGPLAAASRWMQGDTDPDRPEGVAMLATPLLAVGLSALTVPATTIAVAQFAIMAAGGALVAVFLRAAAPVIRGSGEDATASADSGSPTGSDQSRASDETPSRARAESLLEQAIERIPDRSVETPAARAIEEAGEHLEQGAYADAVAAAETARDRAEREAAIVEAIKRVYDQADGDEAAADELETAVTCLADGDYDAAVEHIETASEAVR